ncbi:MAG: glycoside hydrolase family 9 protein [Elusimicrobiota bacterium]
MKRYFTRIIFMIFGLFCSISVLSNCQLPIANCCCYAADVVFEDFENVSKFKANKAANASMTVTPVPGRTGNALKIDYDLTKDHFVEISRPAEIDIKKAREFTWYMKGDIDGSLLEIKFEDEDGSIYGTKIPVIGASKTEWKQFKVPFKELHYMWGGDQTMGKIKSFGLAVSRGAEKKGFVVLDTFAYTPRGKDKLNFEINLNQVGYHPTDSKFFVIRITEAGKEKDFTGEFIVQDMYTGKTIYAGKLEKNDFSDWTGVYLTGDFSGADTPGKYCAKVKLRTKNGVVERNSYNFNINNNILSAMTLVHELNYLNYQRCGIRCHKQDPVMGGWHDTLFDISKRMWSIPSLVYGLARYVEDGQVHVNKTPEGGLGDAAELAWGLKFITEIADSEGTIPWGGIEADFQKVMTYEQFISRIGSLKPEDDLLPRIRYPEKNLYATAFNLVAIVNAIPAVKKKDAALASKAESVAKKAWQWLDKQPLSEARDYGAYLWAATELYKYDSDRKYLHRVNEILPKLLSLQALNFKRFENTSCGDFYTSRSNKDFRFQYKYVSFNIAINLALINLAEILPPDDSLWFDVYYANYVFAENYLKGIASKTPYRQAAHGLEPEKPDATPQAAWQAMSQDGVSGILETMTEGKTGFMRLAFEFISGEWTQLLRPVNMDLAGLETISFDYRYAGPPNNLEIKLSDDHENNFGHRIELKPSSGWISEEIEAKQLKYFWGNNNVLNFKNIKNFWIAVAKTSGGKGLLDIKNIKFTLESGRVIKIPISADTPDNKYLLNYFAGPEAEMAAAPNHGLNCDHLGLAYVGMKLGYLIGDISMEEFADNQASWVMGLNPLNYCMLIGAGAENPTIMAAYFSKPVLNGIIPNGIVGSGLKDEPEWRGDGPSSGEDWLPHNAAYFAALSLLDSPARVSGKVLSNGNPVVDATVEIRENGRPVTRAITRSNGIFGPVILIPQKKYKLIAYEGGRSYSQNIEMLSGDKKWVPLDFNRNFSIETRIDGKIEAGKKTQMTISVSKNAVGKDYKIIIKGAKIGFPAEGSILSENIIVPLIPDGDKPILAVFMIKGYPPVYKALYIKAY